MSSLVNQPLPLIDIMHHPIETFLEQANSIILGKEKTIKLALACILAKGHLLIEDIPGVGKTTLAHTFATLLGLDFQRIQFTSDLLPADIVGSSVFDRDNNTFEFHSGPIFSNFILADEINRATPKTQSALLEAMEEHQVTIEKKTHPMTNPFIVMATQNPGYQVGTFPLPESQLDRFLMRLSIGYPDTESEKKLLNGTNTRRQLESSKPVISSDQLVSLQQQVLDINAAEPLIAYVQALLEFSRSSPLFTQGLSPRAGIALIQAAKAWALIDGRDSVYPEDIQALLPSITEHRLQLQNNVAANQGASSTLLNEVAIP
ncbi:MAG: MoxR family ATPase [Cycloclasticus sp.]